MTELNCATGRVAIARSETPNRLRRQTMSTVHSIAIGLVAFSLTALTLATTIPAA